MTQFQPYDGQGGGNGQGGIPFFQPPTGLSKDQFTSWLKRAQGGVPGGANIDPDQAWTQYQAGKFTLSTAQTGDAGQAVGYGALDPAVIGLLGLPAGGSGTPLAAILGALHGKAASAPADPSAASGAGAGTTPGQGTVQPAFSTQNLQDYEKNYLEPLYNAMYGKGGQVASQIGAVQSAMADTAGMAGQAGSPITKILQAQVAGLLPLQQQYGKDAMFATAFGPLLNIINQTVGNQAALGAKEQATGAGIQNILAYGASDPSFAPYLNAAGLGGLAAAGLSPTGTGVNSLIPTAAPGATTSGG